jgi:hypothetical protein
MAQKEFLGKDIVTTISGIVTLIVTILVTVGVFTSEQGTAITAQVGVIIPAVTSIVGAIASLILIFKARG